MVHERARARASSAAYRERNPDAGKASYKVWYAANVEKKRSDSLSWYRSHTGRAKATNAAWYRHNIDKSRAKARRRRAIKRGVDAEKFTAVEIYERDSWVCQLCSKAVDPILLHPDPLSASLDHRVPITVGGSHTRANVQFAHLVCNTKKGTQLLA